MIEELVARVFKTRNQAHLSHWKTKSFAEHQALGSFYDDVIDTLDKLVEATQGSKGIIGHVDLSCKDESVEIIKCLTDVLAEFQERRSKITDEDVRKFLEIRKINPEPKKFEQARLAK